MRLPMSCKFQVITLTVVKKSHPQPYMKGNYVWLNKDLLKYAIVNNLPSEKFLTKSVGPFNILEFIGKNSVRLHLSVETRIHHVVNLLPLSLFRTPDGYLEVHR